jgi:hypothetical protein
MPLCWRVSFSVFSTIVLGVAGSCHPLGNRNEFVGIDFELPQSSGIKVLRGVASLLP